MIGIGVEEVVRRPIDRRGIGERCPIDNAVVNVPESLFLDLFAASRSAG